MIKSLCDRFYARDILVWTSPADCLANQMVMKLLRVLPLAIICVSLGSCF